MYRICRILCIHKGKRSDIVHRFSKSYTHWEPCIFKPSGSREQSTVYPCISKSISTNLKWSRLSSSQCEEDCSRTNILNQVSDILSSCKSDYLLEIFNDFKVQEDTHMQACEWSDIIDKIKKSRVNIGMSWVLPVTKSLCVIGHYSRSKSLYDYFKETDSRPNLPVGCLIMESCAENVQEIDVHKKMIVDVYLDVKPVVDMLPDRIVKQVIKGVLVTEFWTDSVDMLFGLSGDSEIYSCVTAKAIAMENQGVFMQILKKFLDQNLAPNAEIYNAVFKSPTSDSLIEPLIQPLIEPLFDSMENGRWVLPLSALDSTKQWLMRQNYAVSEAKVTYRKTCSRCGQTVKDLVVTDSEFDLLSEAFIERALIGEDVFINTKPRELKDFLNFLEGSDVRTNYNVVVDALNVAYALRANKRSTYWKSNTLKGVVEKLVDKGMKILIFGRQHMKKWPTENMDYIHEHASLYYLSNQSSDDPFLLYAALHAGKDCYILSSDEMRNHKFLLGTELGRIFVKWQRSRQMTWIKVGGSLQLKMPQTHDTVVQKTDNSWHIPYTDTDDDCQNELKSFQLSNNWVCALKH